MFGPNMTDSQYNAMPKWQRRFYWAAVVTAAGTIRHAHNR